MNTSLIQKEYQYDIAISLCSDEIAYAQEIKSHLNSNLNVFLYTDNQSELISKDGSTEFVEIFRERARIVVILVGSRWSETTNTRIERDAIQDRFLKEGQDFLFIVPFDKENIPVWYTKSTIYADPKKHTAKQIAEFIEFKFTDNKGELVEMTLSDHAKAFKDKVLKRSQHVRYLQNCESKIIARQELDLFIDNFNGEIIELQNSNLGLIYDTKPLLKANLGFGEAEGQIGISNRLVQVTIRTSNIVQDIESSRAHLLRITYCTVQRTTRERYISDKNSIEYYYNDDQNELKGWSERKPLNERLESNKAALYCNDGDYYDLGPIILTDQLLLSIREWLFEGVKDEFKNEVK